MAESDDGSTFGDVLRRFRLRAALSQEELAACAGLSVRGISDLERGVRRSPYLGTVRRLADALNLRETDRTALLAARGASGTGSADPVTADVVAAQPLPSPLTPLVGREREVAQIVSLVRQPDARLVTLTGPGGVGKTRLALAVAAALAPQLDGVYAVDLAPVHIPDRIVTAIAQALGARATGGLPIETAVANAVHDQCILLVLDNFEHLLPAAPLVAKLLGVCPRMTALVTSRARLRVRGERDYLVLPLALPADDHATPLDTLAATAAVQLFVTRARDLQPGFVLTKENAPAVTAICRRLDGLPLAIELAAARITVLPPRMLLDRLGRRLPLLTGGPRDLPARLRTMRDAIVWSLDLLTSREQMLFRRLAVFNGGFSLEAAEAVTGDNSGDVLECLTALVDHSLVGQTGSASGEARFVMLETIREHARERLSAADEEGVFQGRHAAFFLALAANAGRAFIGPDRAEWAERVQTDHDNFLAALRWFLERRDGERSLQMINGLYTLWHWRGQLAEYRGWAQQALAVSAGQPSALRSEAIDLFAELAVQQGDDDSAARLYAEALADAVALGDVEGIARGTLRIGQMAFPRGDLECARIELENAQRAFRVAGFPLWEAAALGELGRVARAAGTPARAAPYLERAMVLYRAGNYIAAYPWILRIQGRVAADLGDRGRACALLAEALEMEYGKRVPRPFAECLIVLADVARGDHAPQIAARLLGAAEALRERVGAVVPASDRADYQRLLAAIRATLDENTLAECWAEGRLLDMDEAVAFALAYAGGGEPRRAAVSARQNGALDTVSPREQAVLRLVVEGRTDQEIADLLFISRRTVTTHVTNILNKLTLTNRVEAATYAVRHGLV